MCMLSMLCECVCKTTGDGQWGIGSMQHDLTDAVQWAVRSGIADPQKICIMGASYGGYATFAGAEDGWGSGPRWGLVLLQRLLLFAACGVMSVGGTERKGLMFLHHTQILYVCVRVPFPCPPTGLAFTPQLYKCGVSFSGIANLANFVQAMPPYWAILRNRWLWRVGNVTGDEVLNRALSPAFHAKNIKASLLMGQGSNDVRVVKVRFVNHKGVGISSLCGSTRTTRSSHVLPVLAACTSGPTGYTAHAHVSAQRQGSFQVTLLHTLQCPVTCTSTRQLLPLQFVTDR